MKPPQSPADPRPHGRPYYIDPHCDDCGADLVLADSKGEPEGETWHDEFICPRCLGGIYMDWPESEMEEFQKRIRAARTEPSRPIEEFMSENGIKGK